MAEKNTSPWSLLIAPELGVVSGGGGKPVIGFASWRTVPMSGEDGPSASQQFQHSMRPDVQARVGVPVLVIIGVEKRGESAFSRAVRVARFGTGFD